MTFQFPAARILVFAREPQAGQVKTRLMPVLGADGARRLYMAMLEDMLTRVRAANLAPLRLCVSNNPSHEVFVTLCNKREIILQKGQDLGQRMGHATATMLASADVDSVLVVGSDCPALSPALLGQALQALANGRDAVLVPAEDGGYSLIGLRKPVPQLFEAIEWGTERVLQQTLARAEQCGLDLSVLESVWDVDRPEDLPRLAGLAPYWAELLAKLGGA